MTITAFFLVIIGSFVLLLLSEVIEHKLSARKRGAGKTDHLEGRGNGR